MTISLAPTAGVLYQAFTEGGLPLNAGLLYTYEAGGTTPAATYTTSAGNVQNANPIVLSAGGRTPHEVWLTDGTSYRFDLKDSAGNLIKTYDNVSGSLSAASLTASSGSSLVGFIAAGSGTVARTVQGKLRDIISIQDFSGVDPTGGSSSTAGIAAAVAACLTAGAILWTPPGNYLHATAGGTITLQEVHIMGPGVTDYANPAAGGAVFSITGTSNVPFKIRKGVTISGCNFYYPNQTDTASPVVYPVLFDCDFTGGSVSGVWLHDNVVFNAYKVLNIDNGATGSVGHMWIEDNELYGINRVFYLRYNAELIHISGNNCTYGVFSSATEGGLGGYTRDNGIVMECDQSDGVIFNENLCFAYKYGWKCSAAQTVTGCIITNNIMDQTLFGIYISGAASWAANQIEGNNFLAFNSQDATDIGNCISLSSSTGCYLDVGINYFGQTSGDHISITGSGAHVVATFGGKAEAMGYGQSSGSYGFLKVNNSSATVAVDNARVIGLSNAYTSGVIATSCNAIDVSDSRFTNCFNAVRCDTFGDAYIVGNHSDATGDTVSDKFTGVGTTLVESSNGAPLNFWDKPSTYASGKNIVDNGSTTTYTLPVWATYNYITTSAASLATTFPAGAQKYDGRRIVVVTSAIVATATWVSSGATFVGAPAAFAANTPVAFIYDHASTKWYRCD